MRQYLASHNALTSKRTLVKLMVTKLRSNQKKSDTYIRIKLSPQNREQHIRLIDLVDVSQVNLNIGYVNCGR